MNEKIFYIPREKLYAHPNNPRRNLGDCAELADSIKSMGILQPLVVVRFNPAEHPAIQTDDPDCYVTIIGHRRRKGGMMAEISAYPAILREMTLSEQIAAMLVENMDREDLSRQEEAHAIQQMFDLGENLETVCQLTGFSKETIRKRRKLLDLDQEKLAQAEVRGGTLQDYMKLDQIADPALRNTVLDAVGTKDFEAELKRARDLQKRRDILRNIAAELNAFAEQVEKVDQEAMCYLRNYPWYNKGKVEIPSDSDQVNYYYIVGEEQVDLYMERDFAKESANQAAQDALNKAAENVERRYQELEEVALRAYELRCNFVHNLTPSKVKKGFGAIVSRVGWYLVGLASTQVCHRLSIDRFMMGDMLGLNVDSAGVIDPADYEESALRVPEYNLLVTMYLLMESNEHRYHQRNYYENGFYNPHINHISNQNLDRIYSLLEALGYVMSNEEAQYRNGTHELFSASVPVETSEVN